MSKFANFRHKNVSNKQTRLLACVEITPPLRRRRASTTPRTATNVPSIETLYHLVFDFRFADGIRYAVCRGASAKVKGHARPLFAHRNRRKRLEIRHGMQLNAS